jgi:hypothetical protein
MVDVRITTPGEEYAEAFFKGIGALLLVVGVALITAPLWGWPFAGAILLGKFVYYSWNFHEVFAILTGLVTFIAPLVLAVLLFVAIGKVATASILAIFYGLHGGLLAHAAEADVIWSVTIGVLVASVAGAVVMWKYDEIDF